MISSLSNLFNISCYSGNSTIFCLYILFIDSELRASWIQSKASYPNHVTTSVCTILGFRFLSPHDGWNLYSFQKGLGLRHSFRCSSDLISSYPTHYLSIYLFPSSSRIVNQYVKFQSGYDSLMKLEVYILDPWIYFSLASLYFPSDIGWWFLWCLIYLPHTLSVDFKSTCHRPSWWSFLLIFLLFM